LLQARLKFSVAFRYLDEAAGVNTDVRKVSYWHHRHVIVT